MALKSESVHETIASLEERRYQAMIQSDITTLDELLADEVVYTHSTAGRDSKASYLEKVADRRLEYLEIVRPEELIVIAGQTAVVASRMTARMRVGGEHKQLDNRCLAVWAQCAGRWQLLAFQGTVIPKA